MTTSQQLSHMQSANQMQDYTNISIKIPIGRITPVDVLCGRGKMCFVHEGNNRFRMLIAEHADTYQTAPTKKTKTKVIILVVEIIISRGGRFLINNNDGTWVDGGRQQGKKKTGHAFRDALRGRVKCITLMRNQNAHTAIGLNANDSHTLPSLSANNGKCDWDASDEFDLKPIIVSSDFNIEPSQEWRRNTNINVEMANDLINFFLETDNFNGQRAQTPLPTISTTSASNVT